MTQEIQIFQKTEVLEKEIDIFGNQENPLFLAKDVAEWIDHSDVSTMLRMVDEDEKLTQTLFVSGQNRDVWFLTEDGLYEVLMMSNKPIAKKLKKKIKHLLSGIRKREIFIVAGGQYTIPKKMSEALLLSANLAEKVENQQKQIEYDKPKVEFYDTVTKSDAEIEIGDVANIIGGIGRNNLFKFLRSQRILRWNNSPYRTYVKRGYFRVVEVPFQKPDGKTYINLKTVVRQSGVEFIKKLLYENYII